MSFIRFTALVNCTTRDAVWMSFDHLYAEGQLDVATGYTITGLVRRREIAEERNNYLNAGYALFRGALIKRPPSSCSSQAVLGLFFRAAQVGYGREPERVLNGMPLDLVQAFRLDPFWGRHILKLTRELLAIGHDPAQRGFIRRLRQHFDAEVQRHFPETVSPCPKPHAVPALVLADPAGLVKPWAF